MADILTLLERFERHENIRCAITRRVSFPTTHNEELFFANRMYGDMKYLEEHRPLKRSLSSVLPSVRSVVICAIPYRIPEQTPNPIAGYAWGEDYHSKVNRILSKLVAILGLSPGSWRICVDSCPVPERTLAATAGLGWIGQSGNLVVPGIGPNVLLGEILTSADLPETRPLITDTSPRTCGTCTICIDSCPTGALQGGGLVDARLCLSYHTTESREYPAPDILDTLGPRIFGCDECVKVCPYSHSPTHDTVPLVDMEHLPDAVHFTKRNLRNTALEHLSMWRFLRNVALALRYHPDGADARKELEDHPHPQVRKAARQTR